MIRIQHALFLVLACAGALLWPAAAGAQVTEALEHFDEGNRLYTAGAYADALAAYEQAVATGYVSGALFLNMGNAYYRLDELGQALRYYEKARRLIPNDPALQHNLSIARSRIETPISSLPTPFWVSWWRRVVVRAGALPFLILGLACYGAAVGLLAYRIWTATRNPWRRRALTLAVVAGLLLLSTAFGVSLDRSIHRQAVVITPEASLHDEPDATSAAVLHLSEGILVDVLDQSDAWREVRLPNGDTGWIAADALADV